MRRKKCLHEFVWGMLYKEIWVVKQNIKYLYKNQSIYQTKIKKWKT